MTEQTQIAEFNQTEGALAVLKEKYTEIPDCSTKEGYEECRIGIAELRTLRTSLDKVRKGLNADDQARINFRNSEAKRITGELTALENPMKAAKQAVDEEKERKKREAAEKEQKRVDMIRHQINLIGVSMQAYPGMSEEDLEQCRVNLKNAFDFDFQEFAEQAKLEFERVSRHLEKVFEERNAHIEEQERVKEEQAKLEAERKRLAEEQAKIEEERKEAAAAMQKAQEEAEAAKREAEEEKRKIQAEREAEQKAKEEEARKEQESKAMAERVAAEEKRQESLRPDKDKLHDWFAKLRQIDGPAGIKAQESKDLLAECLEDLNFLSTNYMEKLEKL